jgi:hypothetical protein
MEIPTHLPEEEINPVLLRQLFRAAYLKAELDDDDDVRVTAENGVKVILSVDEDRKMLKYMAVFGFKEDAPEAEKLELLNLLNDQVVLVRFSSPRADALVADYYLLYEGGVAPFQVIHSLRWFTKVAIGALTEYDTSDLLE